MSNFKHECTVCHKTFTSICPIGLYCEVCGTKIAKERTNHLYCDNERNVVVYKQPCWLEQPSENNRGRRRMIEVAVPKKQRGPKRPRKIIRSGGNENGSTNVTA